MNEKKTFYWLLWLALITTPLFGVLGGTPFSVFTSNDFSHFLPSIYFISLITFLFWLINIGLLLLAQKYIGAKKIIYRLIISILICLPLSIGAFHYFRIIHPPPVVKFDDAAFIKREFNQPIENGEWRRFDSFNAEFKSAPYHKFSHRNKFFFIPQIIHSLTINVVIFILCELVFSHFRKRKIEDENALLRQANLEAKNNQLNMQLQPHFLFNSLNTLRLLLFKDPERAESYLIKLSEILRSAIESSTKSVTSVKDELNLCIGYLEMQKVRFGEMLFFTFPNPEIMNAKGKIPLYSLQMLAENAIKHNSFTIEEPLEIIIDYNEDRQEITVKNKTKPKRIAEATTKIGLKNLNERYKLLANESILILEGDEMFSVTIKIL